MTNPRFTLQGPELSNPPFRLWEAVDESGEIRGAVALRRVPAEMDSPALRQALTEAVATMPALPGLEPITEVGADDEGTFLAGPLTRGQTLAERLSKVGHMSAAVAISTGEAMARALVACHRAGIVHGDLRPENVLLVGDGDVRLLLGGLSRAYGQSPEMVKSVYPLMAPYLAPEMQAAPGPTRAADVYAIGAMVAQMIAGRALAPDEPLEPGRAQNVVRQAVERARAADPALRPADATALYNLFRESSAAVRFGRPVPGVTPPLPEPEPVAIKPPQEMKDVIEEEPTPTERRERDVPACLLGCLFVMILIAGGLGALFWYYAGARPTMVVIPKTRGYDIPSATKTLKAKGLTLVERGSRSDPKIPSGRIIMSVPDQGTKVASKTQVAVVVSTGPASISLPDFTGKSPTDAIAEIAGLGLKPTLNPDEVDSAVVFGRIARQIPAPGSQVSRGDEVQLFKSRGRTSRRLPKYVTSLTITLKDIERPTKVRVTVKDADGERTLHDQEHKPDDVVRISAEVSGDQAIFTVLYDGKPVKTIPQNLG